MKKRSFYRQLYRFRGSSDIAGDLGDDCRRATDIRRRFRAKKERRGHGPCRFRPAQRGGISYVLLHEACHIFGAVDLRTEGRVMSLRNPSFRLDGFPKAIIRANRLRSFLAGLFPLPEDTVPEAIALYEGRQALGLGEDEIAICLRHL